MKKLAVIFGLILLTSCATFEWRKSGVTRETLGRDSMYCEQFANQSVMMNGLQDTMLARAMEKVQTENRCMQNLGYFQIRTDK